MPRGRGASFDVRFQLNGADTVPGGGAGAIGTTPVMTGEYKLDPKPVCSECGRMYSSVSNLKQHMANVHSNSNAWEPCPICGKHFKTRQYLFNHLLQTHGIRQRSNRMSVSCPPPLTVTSSTQPVPSQNHLHMPPPLPSLPTSPSLQRPQPPTTFDQCFEMLTAKDGSRQSN